MKIVQTVFGKFHHFHLARQLHKRGMLEAIFSSYPSWKLRNEGLPMEKIKTFPWIHTAMMAKWRFGMHNDRLDKELAWALANTLDRHVANKLPHCDVFIGISGSGLRTGGISQKRGAKYICDRGSTHIQYAKQILDEEYNHWGLKFPGIDPRAIERERAEYYRSDIITVPSEFVRKSFIEKGVNPNKIRKIPYGADLNMFAPVDKPPDDVFEVLFVGQVSLRKGIPYLLKGFSKFKHSKKRLRIVGSAFPGMDVIFKRHDMGQVELMAPIPYNKLKYIMSKSHVMVLPSIEEGLALVQGHAMACGCPLISSINTGAEDLFTNGREGFIIPIRDSDAITEKLEIMAQNRQKREEMSVAALERVNSIKGWDTYGDQFARLCQEITLVNL
ncbi:glycosyltransferase family 4 protein [candidate division TA06 bacterium]|uniref:Glycosyltransferase family 4 protein n=1 Tax=candidate division TA06 bacterium TaxID=2250710 RepID=A0A933MJQ8_UNCT6|nr:glycosyltransferase family 4 protein [candidate division TA06 bacterium]